MKIKIGDYPELALCASFGFRRSDLVDKLKEALKNIKLATPAVHFSGNRIFMIHNTHFVPIRELWVEGDTFDSILDKAECTTYT